MKKLLILSLMLTGISCLSLFAQEKPQRASLPKVLLIGDSISLGYTPHVMKDFKGKAMVKHHKGNAQHTGTGLKKLDQWLEKKEGTQWDVIHFNWGLWDLCYRHPESKVQGKRDKKNGTLTTSIEQYEENLEKLVMRLKLTEAKLIWANTTVIPEEEAGRIVGDAENYNAVATKIMLKHGVSVNDLHALTKKFPAKLFVGLGDVHYTQEGSRKLADQVTEHLSEALKAKQVVTEKIKQGAKKKPNIVFILSDDQAWSDYGFMGHDEIKTPHLDKLAEQGVVFKRGYVASPICRPSLASIVTGRYPQIHGVTGNDVDGGKNRAELDKPLRENFHQYPSFIKLLTSNGYLTHQSGKWWEGSYQQGGFTHGMTHGDPKRKGRHGDEGLTIGRDGLKPVTDFIEMAVAEEKPFFLWYAPFLPHTPHNPPARLHEKYKQEGRAADVTKYYAMCEWFDETCGELLGYLDEKKLTEDTMVIYICDNGWAAASTNADDPNQKKWRSYGLRSKAAPYENGIRTPIMISWPGHTTPEDSPDLAHSIDIFPTIAAAAGLELPAVLPGINLLDQKARAERKIVFGVNHSTHNMTIGDTHDTLQFLWCVEGDWKLLVRYDGKDTTQYHRLHVWDTARLRLYNIKDDPGELKDLAAEHPEAAQRLKKKIEAWYKASNVSKAVDKN